jgi:hypothetical protein
MVAATGVNIGGMPMTIWHPRMLMMVRGRSATSIDMADIRNHRHHGLIGALIVEPGDAQPFALNSKAKEADGWTGLNAEIRVNGKVVARETVVFIQDGLRFFVNGNPDFPMPDVNPTDDPEDSGQKGINYRSHPIHHGVVSRQETPVFPLLEANAGDKIWLHIIGAGDKPRQHTITVHGCDWPQASWKPTGAWTGALTGLSPCRAATMEIVLPHKGDYAVRAGASAGQQNTVSGVVCGHDRPNRNKRLIDPDSCSQIATTSKPLKLIIRADSGRNPKYTGWHRSEYWFYRLALWADWNHPAKYDRHH